MAEIKIPPLPEKAKKAVISQWLVQEGDSIDEGDAVAEIESKGESLPVNAPAAGVISDIYFEEGEEIPAGEIIAEIEED